MGWLLAVGCWLLVVGSPLFYKHAVSIKKIYWIRERNKAFSPYGSILAANYQRLR
jgi:hypothetical protein